MTNEEIAIHVKYMMSMYPAEQKTPEQEASFRALITNVLQNLNTIAEAAYKISLMTWPKMMTTPNEARTSL